MVCSKLELPTVLLSSLQSGRSLQKPSSLLKKDDATWTALVRSTNLPYKVSHYHPVPGMQIAIGDQSLVTRPEIWLEIRLENAIGEPDWRTDWFETISYFEVSSFCLFDDLRFRKFDSQSFLLGLITWSFDVSLGTRRTEKLELYQTNWVGFSKINFSNFKVLLCGVFTM